MDVCEICRKPLSRCATTWVAGGKLFCSDLCCARYLLTVYAEEVNTQDIGIPYKDPKPTKVRIVHKKTHGVPHMPDRAPLYDDTYMRILEDRSTCEETIIIRKE